MECKEVWSNRRGSNDRTKTAATGDVASIVCATLIADFAADAAVALDVVDADTDAVGSRSIDDRRPNVDVQYTWRLCTHRPCVLSRHRSR